MLREARVGQAYGYMALSFATAWVMGLLIYGVPSWTS